MKILNRLPYFPEHKTISVHGDTVDIQRYQIIVWVSVNVPDPLVWDRRIPAFPAILDPGNNFTLSLFESQLIRWAGIRPELLRLLGRIKHKGKRYPRHEADVWLHHNIPGSQDRKPDQDPFRLSLKKGIAIYPDEQPTPPHLPVLGLRALTESNLHLSIDGRQRLVSLRTEDWRTKLLRLLS